MKTYLNKKMTALVNKLHILSTLKNTCREIFNKNLVNGKGRGITVPHHLFHFRILTCTFCHFFFSTMFSLTHFSKHESSKIEFVVSKLALYQYYDL